MARSCATSRRSLAVSTEIDIVFCKFVLDDDKRPKIRVAEIEPEA
jgi:hypothetical protein